MHRGPLTTVLLTLSFAAGLTAQKPTDLRLSLGRAAGAANVVGPQVAAAGNAVYCAFADGRNGGSDVFANASGDAGLTWLPSDVRINHGPIGSHAVEPRLAAARSPASVCVVWMDDRNGSPDIYANCSLDGGATWLSNDVRLDVGSAPGSSVSIEPRIAMSGSSVYVAWIDLRSSSGDVYANVSHDSGATWLASDQKLNSGSGGAGDIDLAAADPFVHVVWNDARNGGQDVYYSRSANSGASWFGTDVRLNVGVAAGSVTSTTAPAIAIAQSNVYVAWSDARNAASTGTAGDPFCVASHDVGSSWPTLETRLDNYGGPAPAGGTGAPRLCAVANGVIATWADARSGNTDIYANASIDAGVNWRGDVRLDLGDAAGASVSDAPQISAAGTAAQVVWVDHRDATAHVRSNRSPDLGQSWFGTDLRLDPGVPAGARGATGAQVAVVTGAAFVTWADDRASLQQNDDVYFNLAFGYQQYGAGTPGTFGGIPTLTGAGLMLAGATASLNISNAPGGAAGALVLGLGPASQIAVSFVGGTLLVAPAKSLLITLSGPSGIPGIGARNTLLSIPNSAVLLGTNLNAQALVLDSGAAQGVSMSSAVAGWIG